eukprot:COSAG01_NODE_720_length_14070_cov_9.960633_3_plen_133_part_00
MHIMRYIFLTLMVVTLSPDRAAAAEASQPPPPGSPRAAAPPPQEGQTLTTGQADYSEDDSNFDDEEQAAPAGIPRIPKDQKIQLTSKRLNSGTEYPSKNPSRGTRSEIQFLQNPLSPVSRNWRRLTGFRRES